MHIADCLPPEKKQSCARFEFCVVGAVLLSVIRVDFWRTLENWIAFLIKLAVSALSCSPRRLCSARIRRGNHVSSGPNSFSGEPNLSTKVMLSLLYNKQTSQQNKDTKIPHHE